MGYISVAVETDVSAITQEKIEAMEARIPGLTIQVGHPLYILLEVTSERDAANAELLTEVTDLIWDTFGEKILRVTRSLSTQATGLTTWTRVDTTDYPLAAPLTIEAGTGLSLLGSDGERVAFLTRNEVTFAAAAATTDVGEVEIIAVEAGATGTGLQGGPLADDTLPWLDSIVVEAPTSGGSDEETVEDYRDRLADEASLMARTLVLPENFATRSQSITGVDLALAIDNYDPGPPIDAAAPGHITVAVRDVNGADPGTTVKDAVDAELQADALTNLEVHVIGPTFTAIDVVFAATSYSDFDPADVETRAEAAVLEFLNPALWGLPPFGDQRRWLDKPVVRYRDVVAVVENVEGLDYTTALTVNGGTADVTLTGPAGLPSSASTAVGTVTAP